MFVFVWAWYVMLGGLDCVVDWLCLVGYLLATVFGLMVCSQWFVFCSMVGGVADLCY